MNLIDLYAKLKKGKITIDYRGHQFNPITDRLKEAIDHTRRLAMDGNQNISGIAQQILMQDIPYNTPVSYGLYESIKCYCFHCDLEYLLMLTDERHATFIPASDYYQWKKDHPEELPKNNPLLQVQCPMDEICQSGKLTAPINVPTGKLVFANFFGPEEIYIDHEYEYQPGHSINTVSGRHLLMQYLAEKNVGYGQMGNMSVALFVKKDGKEIIVGPCYTADKETSYKGFTRVGKLSLEVWRWQCADCYILDQYEEPLRTEDGSKIEHIEIPVRPGQWQIEHRFDLMDYEESRSGEPFSRLTWQGEIPKPAKPVFEPSQKVIDLAKEAQKIIKQTDETRCKVHYYQRKILALNRWPNTYAAKGAEPYIILDPEKIHLLGEPDKTRYHELCRKEAERAGLNVSIPGTCPLLEAEEKQRCALHAFGDALLPELPDMEGVTMDVFRDKGIETYKQVTTTFLEFVSWCMNMKKEEQLFNRFRQTMSNYNKKRNLKHS